MSGDPQVRAWFGEVAADSIEEARVLRAENEQLRGKLRAAEAREADYREQLALLWRYRPGRVRRFLLERIIGGSP